MTKVCDNYSVGVVIADDNGRLLLIERKKFPFGFALPAGHIDDFSSPEACAIGEVKEEVGLTLTEVELIHEKRYENKCRRLGGDYHHWYVFKAGFEGEVVPSADETKQVVWADPSTLRSLADRTSEYLAGNIEESEWKKNPGLEPVWVEILQANSIL
tara:strand:- start:302 stop:772 length:471 start_codon:yes stop_codon:yes gene_type:complete